MQYICRTCKKKKQREDFYEKFLERRNLQCKTCSRVYQLASNKKIPSWRRAIYQRKRNLKLRGEFIKAYGGACTCCGETNFGFLSMDHVEGDGARSRRASGGNMPEYLQAKREGWPDRYTVLCYNCNLGRHYYGKGTCPHELGDVSF